MVTQVSKVKLAAAAAIAALTVVALLLGNGPSSRACAAPVEDPLDARSLQHALEGTLPTYATEPPTSGPHQPGSLPSGVVSAPLPGPVQVGALEAGQVLLQHRDLGPDELASLEALATPLVIPSRETPLVIVAPNPALPSKVVASAWRTRQLCDEVDTSTLTRFIKDHAGRHEEHRG